MLTLWLVRFGFLVVGAWVGLKIIGWKRNHVNRPCWFFGHDKQWLAIKTVGCVSGSDPNANGEPFTCGHRHYVGEKGIYQARWSCRRCPKLGEDCLDSDQDWTIEHEELVPDVKKWTNWSKPK